MNELPGKRLVDEGLRDLNDGLTTPAALALQAFRTRLAGVGVLVPEHPGAELELYQVLRLEDRTRAYVRFHAILDELLSFLVGAERRAAVRTS